MVEIAELSLTLVELVKISLLKSNSGVSLINLNTKVILDALDSQVLTKGAELVVDVLIVGPLLLPLADQHLQCLVQHWFGTHLARVWCRSQSEVRFLDDLALASDAHMLGELVESHVRILFTEVHSVVGLAVLAS